MQFAANLQHHLSHNLNDLDFLEWKIAKKRYYTLISTELHRMFLNECSIKLINIKVFFILGIILPHGSQRQIEGSKQHLQTFSRCETDVCVRTELSASISVLQ